MVASGASRVHARHRACLQALLVFGGVCLSATFGCTGIVTGTDDTPTTDDGSGPAGPSGLPAGVDPGTALIHRLNTAEYNNTVGDVLGTALKPGTDLWAGEQTLGFDNIAAVQSVDTPQFQRYYDAAIAVAADVFGSPALKAKVVTCAATDDVTCVKSVVNAIGLKLFRRPLLASEVDRFVRVYTESRGQTLTHDASLQQVLTAVLASAEFLFRMEFDSAPDAPQKHPLSSYELASRLSYFLWRSAPDDQLNKAAADDSLNKSDVLSSTVDSMLKDPKAQRFSRSFVGQWLGIKTVADHGVKTNVFPDWTPALGASMGEEAYRFFDEFLKTDRSWREFVTADINFVDANLAKLYGIPAPASGMQRVEYTADQRAGFLGTGAFLSLSSYDYRTAPTLRGRWILLNLLCSPPGDPPPNVPKLDMNPDAPDASQENVRARLEAHRKMPPCAGCHAALDPPGLALENFDAIGKYRTTYPNGSAIDASTSIGDAQFSGLSGLNAYMAKNPMLLECVEQKLFTYGLGRGIQDTDQPYLDQIQATWQGNTPSLQRLIKLLVLAETFRQRHG